MSKTYRRIGAKSSVIMIRISEAMEIDLDNVCEQMQMSKSDFVRVAIRNGLTYYSRKQNQLSIAESETIEFQRAYNLAMKKDDPILNVPSDEEVKNMLEKRSNRLAKK